MSDDGSPQPRNQAGRSPALRIAQLSPTPQRMVEGPPMGYYQPPPPQPRLSFWQISLRAIPIILALVSMALLAYFVLIGQRPQPFAQLQQQGVAQNASSGPQGPQPVPQQVAQSGQPPAQAQQPQQPMPQNGQQQPLPQPPPQPQPEDLGPRLPMPNDDGLFLLIQSTLIALNQANLTGNYSVLRDLSAPGLQKVGSDRLAKSFADLRSRKMDLTPILLFQPKLLRRPEMNDAGMLRISGFVPTAPERVNFDFIFQPVQGKWRLFGMSVNLAHVQQPPAEVAEPAPAPAPKAEAPPKPASPPAKAKKAAAEPPPEPEEDIRDRLDNPPPPSAPKPKPKSIFNPFGN